MRILVLQHHAAEHPGIFRDFMAEDGISWDPVHLYDGESLPALDDYDALWAMGGPMDVWDEDLYPWLAAEKVFIREAVHDRRLPFLGCCLGHQLLAVAMGGRCERMPVPRIGIGEAELTADAHTDPLFVGIEPRSSVLQWHGVAVTEVPSGTAVLAYSPAGVIQAVRIGDRAWGLQYHVEVTDSTVDEWGAIREYAGALHQALGEDPLPKLRADTAAHMDDFRRNARRVYENFIAAARA